MFRLAIAGVVLCAVGAAEAPEQAQLDVANGWYSRGFYEEAVEAYRAYLDAYPNSEQLPTALYRLGESLYAVGDLEAALQTFERLLGQPGAEAVGVPARVAKGEILRRLKRFPEAEAVLKPLVDAGLEAPHQGRALYALGELYVDMGNPEAALAAFKKLIEGLPDDPRVPYARYNRALLYLARNDLEAAALEFNAVSDAAGAGEALRAESRFRAAETYDQIGWFDAAVKAYAQLGRDFPESAYAPRARYGEAWALYHGGDYATAAARAADFLARSPDSPDAAGLLYLQANCLQQQKRYEEAIAAYRDLVARYPATTFAERAQYKTAWALHLSGKPDEARAAITEFLKTARDKSLAGDAGFLLGTILAAQKNYGDAYEEFRLVAEKYSEGEFAPEALYKSGECLAQLGRTQEAAGVFEQFVARYPDNPLAEEALLRAGDAAFFSTAFQGAIEKYNQVLAANPNPRVQENTLYRMAITYHNMQDYASSAATFQRLLEAAPNTSHAAEAHLRIGDYLLREKKDPLKAIEAYQAACDADKQGPCLGRALKGLALARYETKDYDGAAAMFLRVMREFPDVPLNDTTCLWVGDRFFGEERWDAAAEAYRALLRSNPAYANPEQVLFTIAECAERAGKGDVIGQYRAVAERAPNSALAIEAKYRMARLYEAGKAPDKALTLYEEVADTNTGDTAARARFRLGELYEAGQDYVSAAKSYMRVAILFLHEELTPESLWRAGRCYEKAQRPDEAKKAYQELVDEFPDSEQARQSRARLGGLG